LTVIDFHVHVGRGCWKPAVIEYLRSFGNSPEKIEKTLTSPEDACRFLTGEGLDYAVVLAEYAPKVTGIVTNDYVKQFCAGNEMLVPFASMDPTTEKNAAGLLKKLVERDNFRGLKLYPTYQHFFPNDGRLAPLYKAASGLGVPVMFHTGSSIFPGSKIKYGDPLLLDDVASDFPDLKLVIAHSGRPIWYDEAFWMARLHRNVYLEITGIPPKTILIHFPEIEKVADKVLFGSDWPGTPGIRKMIESIRKIPLSKATIEKILGGNAKRVLGV
jgi:predicted TIM-barrel fold metal-dependent hydrolase